MEKKGFGRLGPGEVVPPNMPHGITGLVDTENDKLYVEDANGGIREFIEGLDVETGTLTPESNWEIEEPATYIRHGRMVFINILLSEDGPGLLLFNNIPQSIRPTDKRNSLVFENDIYGVAVRVRISADGEINVFFPGGADPEGASIFGTISYII